jgi:hypothetical protein
MENQNDDRDRTFGGTFLSVEWIFRDVRFVARPARGESRGKYRLDSNGKNRIVIVGEKYEPR